MAVVGRLRARQNFAHKVHNSVTAGTELSNNLKLPRRFIAVNPGLGWAYRDPEDDLTLEKEALSDQVALGEHVDDAGGSGRAAAGNGATIERWQICAERVRGAGDGVGKLAGRGSERRAMDQFGWDRGEWGGEGRGVSGGRGRGGGR